VDVRCMIMKKIVIEVTIFVPSEWVRVHTIFILVGIVAF